MSNLKTYAESKGLMPFGEDYFFGNLKGYSSTLFVNPAGKQLTIHTCISDEEQQEKLQKFLQTSDVKATLAWLGYTLAPGRRGAATLPLLFTSTLLNLLAGTRIAGLVCAISGKAIDIVQLFAYTFIGFILGVVILLFMQLVAFMFRDKEMTGVIDLE